MTEAEVGYLSECPRDYARDVGKAETLPDLLAVLDEWAWIAPDARADAPCDEADFEVFRRGLLSERSGEFAGETWAERFGAILIPERMLRISEAAMQYGVPWGTLYVRARDEGMLNRLFMAPGFPHCVNCKGKPKGGTAE